MICCGDELFSQMSCQLRLLFVFFFFFPLLPRSCLLFSILLFTWKVMVETVPVSIHSPLHTYEFIHTFLGFFSLLSYLSIIYSDALISIRFNSIISVIPFYSNLQMWNRPSFEMALWLNERSSSLTNGVSHLRRCNINWYLAESWLWFVRL